MRAPRARGRRETIELRRVTIKHGGAARFEPGEDLGFGVGNGLDRAEILEMHRRDRGHQRDMRPRQGDERRDLAGVIHADLDRREGGARRQLRQRQRHAPMIVVGRGGGVGRAEPAERDAQHFLGAGLADRAGDRNDARLRPRPRRRAEALQGAQGVVDRENRLMRGNPGAARPGDRRGRRARLEGARDVVVAVARLAPDGEEEIAGLQRAGVDRNALDGDGERRARGPEGARELRFAP